MKSPCTLFAYISLFLFLLCFLRLDGQQQHQLKVSPDQRYLVKQDGSPFFYLGDTAWELFHRLNRKQADNYLTNRAEKGFTVIQAVALAELDGLNDPNPYGHLPLKNNDPTQPNEEYFRHVDYIVNKAQKLGLYVGLLPTWGDKVFKNTWGIGPEIFNPENARKFGEFMGQRYKNNAVIWIIGGDRNPRENSQDVEIWRSMAKGIVKGAGGNDKVMMTFHPQPVNQGSSSNWFHDEEWLDFNMHQTGHCPDRDIYKLMQDDYTRSQVKPTMNGEPIYEDHPVCFDAAKNGYSYPSMIRYAAYVSLFSGAHGHTYGCHNIWQMWSPGKNPVNGPLKPWYESLELPGAVQMSYVRALMESRPVLDRVPDQSLISGGQPSTSEKTFATRGKDYLFIYSAEGTPFPLQMGKISGKTVNSSWFNPRTGKTTKLEKAKNSGIKIFTPPETGNKQDWVLIVDDASKGYQAPKLISTKP